MSITDPVKFLIWATIISAIIVGISEKGLQHMNVMQYLFQMSEEFRESYSQIDKRITEILDKLELVEIRLRELELRLNANRRDD